MVAVVALEGEVLDAAVCVYLLIRAPRFESSDQGLFSDVEFIGFQGKGLEHWDDVAELDNHLGGEVLRVLHELGVHHFDVCGVLAEVFVVRCLLKLTKNSSKAQDQSKKEKEEDPLLNLIFT